MYCRHYSLTWHALMLYFDYAERLFLSNDSRQDVVGPSTVYSEAT